MAQVAAEGAIAFWRRHLDDAVHRLLPLKSHLRHLGGSVLDQEIVLMTLIESALRSPDAESADHGLVLARALLVERTALRTGSAQSWLRYAAVLDRQGDVMGADGARRNAYIMGIGQGGHSAH